MRSSPQRAWSEVWTVDQVASYLQLNRLTVYRYIRTGQLRASKVGKAYRVRKTDVDAFLDSMRARPSARRLARAVQPKAVPEPRREPVQVASRPDSADLRDRELSFNPMEWVTRGLH